MRNSKINRSSVGEVLEVEHGVFFDRPGTATAKDSGATIEKRVVLYNPSFTVDVQVNSVTLEGDIYGITIGDYSSCQPVCNIGQPKTLFVIDY